MGSMVPKVVVTGTKGKTTVTNFISDILRRSGTFDNVLHVNTSGHFLNGRQKSTLRDSLALWNLVPTVAPGRYLYEFFHIKYHHKNNVAVLESSLGSSGLSGLAIGDHDVGIFLNVFKDHIGSSDRIRSQNDILEAKRFVFKKLQPQGWYIANYDDALVRSTFGELKADQSLVVYGMQLTVDLFDQLETIKGIITVEKGSVVYFEKKHRKKHILISLADIQWTFNGKYTPSISNAMAVIGGLIGLYKGKVNKKLLRLIGETKQATNSGRLTLFKAKSGALILADYAHEQESLQQVADLGRRLVTTSGKLYGVVRIAYDRTEQMIQEVASIIAPKYDHVYVYDKIDGFHKKPSKLRKSKKFVQKIGLTSKLVEQALLRHTSEVTRIIREDVMLQHVAGRVTNGDVVVVIVNDDTKRSVEYIQKYFNARRI